MQRFIKRLIDLLAALALIFLLSPVILVVAALVHSKLGSPVLFRQNRIGYRERPFHLLKFRTMTDARDAAGNLLPDAQRLTTFGKTLRTTSLDELPSLWNLLIGEISLVGPRPFIAEYQPYYSEEERLRHQMRPGITGLAQVMGRNSLSWNERLQYDIEYVRRFSLKLDLWILWRTVMVVLKREGISAEGHVTMGRLDDERRGATHE